MAELSEDIIMLIEAIVEKKISASRLNIQNITSSGDLSISSMGNIHIKAGDGKKVFVNGTGFDIGSSGELRIHPPNGKWKVVPI